MSVEAFMKRSYEIKRITTAKELSKLFAQCGDPHVVTFRDPGGHMPDKKIICSDADTAQRFKDWLDEFWIGFPDDEPFPEDCGDGEGDSNEESVLSGEEEPREEKENTAQEELTTRPNPSQRPYVVTMATSKEAARATLVVFFKNSRIGKGAVSLARILCASTKSAIVRDAINASPLPKGWRAEIRDLTTSDTMPISHCAHRMGESQSEGYFCGSKKFADAIAELLNKKSKLPSRLFHP